MNQETPLPPRTLRRSMRVVGALLLTLSAITPASSVFVIVPVVFQQAGTGAFLSMAATAIVSLSVAYVYAELSSAFPIAGGEYSMVGKSLGPGAGFVTLALTAFGNMLAPSVLALGAAPYVAALYPGLDARVVAIAIIVLTTVMGILHVRTNAWVTGVFLLLEVLALAVLAVLGFAHIQRPLTELILHPVYLTQSGNFATTTLSMIGFSAAASVFAYNGYGAAVYFSEEMHEAPKLVASTIMWALVLTVATELIPITAVLMGAPDVKALLSSNPFGYFIPTVGGRALNIAVSLSIALAIFNAVLATVMQNGRFFFATGRDGTWHVRINDAFTLTHSSFNSPWVATLVSGATAVATCFLGLTFLSVLTGMGIVFMYAAVCLGSLMGRRTGATAHAAYRMPFFPLVPLFALLSLGFVLYASVFDPDNRLSLIANAVLVIVALLYYRFVLCRRGGTWVLRGPDDDKPAPAPVIETALPD